VFGYEPDRTVGSSGTDRLVPPDRREESQDVDERVRAGALTDEHLRRQPTDGLHDFRFRHGQLPPDHRVDGSGSYADVTTRMQRERGLQRQYDLFREPRSWPTSAPGVRPRTDALTWTEGSTTSSPASNPSIPLESALAFYHPADRDAVEAAVTDAITGDVGPPGSPGSSWLR
jgi:hypothetical protein